MKKRITRITTMFMAVFIMAIIAALPVTAFAASSDTAVAISEEANVYDSDMTVIQPMVNNYEEPVIQQLGNNQGEQKAKSGSASGDTAYESIMDMILTWVRRAAAAVGVFGGIALGFSIKKKDPDAKEDAIMTMAAGFVVCALLNAADMFNLYE